MNEQDHTAPKEPASPLLQRIDRVCDEFEADWLSRGQADIARYLHSVSPAERPALIFELVQLDVDYRRKNGENPVALEYEQQFPDFISEVRQAINDDTPGSGTGVDDSTQRVGPAESLPVSNDSHTTSQIGEQFGDYELLNEIARGGMGVVYKARQIKANRIVALKMILAGGFAGDEEVRRFYAEAQAAANLDHPNIVPVFDAGEINGQHYFSMGFINGTSLADEVRDGPLEPKRAAQIMKTTAEAIAFAHGKQIVHRDLKPANILLDQDGNPRVTDFGLAKQVTGNSGLTVTGQVLGTPSYMPPEQALGNISEVGLLSDVYSLGAVQYHLLTGRPPFRAASVVETLTQVVEQVPVAPRQLNPAIDQDLNTITLKALEKNPAKRYASAQDLADDLARFLGHRPIVARKISTTGHVVRWARRNRLVAALLSLSVLSMVATTTLSIVAAIQFQREGIRQRESAEKQMRLRKETEAARKITTQNLYDAQITNAGVALSAPSGIGQVRELVDNWSPRDQPDLPGWEWHFLYAVSHREQRVLSCQQDTRKAIWHPNGDIAALIGTSIPVDGVHLVNVDEEDTSFNVVSTGVWNYTRSLCWGPNGDWFAATGQDIVAAWDYPSRRPRWKRTDLENDNFGAICYSTTLNVLAARSRDGRLFVLSPDDGSTIKVLPDHPGVEPNTIGFSPNGKWLATSLNARPEGTVVKVWDTESWDSYAEFAVEDHKVFALAWSPDSKLLAAAGDEATVRLFDVHNKSLWYSYTQHDRRITDLAWHPDNERLASCSEDFTIVINDLRTDLHLDRLRGHTDTVNSIDWSGDGRRLISVGGDDVLRIWDLSDSPPDEQTNMEMTSRQYAGSAKLQWHPRDDVLALSLDSPEDGRILTWDVPQRKRSVLQSGLAPTWSHNGEYLAAVVDQTITIYTADGSIYKQADFQRREDNFSLDWHPHEITLALANQRSLFLWNIEQPTPRLLRDDSGHLRAVAWSPSGKEIAVGTLGLYLEIWDAGTGNVLRRSQPMNNMYTTDIAWDSDGTRIASTALDRTDVMVWDALTLNDFVSLRGHTYGILNVDWSPDGSRLASSGRDETVRIWNTESNKLLLTLEYHAVDDIGWNRSGRRLAAIGKHGHLKIWDATAGYREFSP